MIRLRDPEQLREWHDLLIRPTQRVLNYQIFVGGMKRDAETAGCAEEAAALEHAGCQFREVLRKMNESTSSFVKDCKQTVNVILRQSPDASPGVVQMLKGQSRILLHFDAFQTSQRVRFRGGEKLSLAGRQVLAFEDFAGNRCVVILSQRPALCFLEAIRFRDLSLENSGELRQCSATTLELVRRRHHRLEARGLPRECAFELDGRIFTAEESAAHDLLQLLGRSAPEFAGA